MQMYHILSVDYFWKYNFEFHRSMYSNFITFISIKIIYNIKILYSFSISDKISITDIERKAYWKIWKNLQFVISTSQLFFPQYLCIHLHVHAIKLIVTVLPIYIMKYSLTIKNCPNPVPKVHFSLVWMALSLVKFN